MPVPGGNGDAPLCMAQKEQCSNDVEAACPPPSGWSTPAFTNLAPPGLHTSVQISPRAAPMAWETDGASAANRIAKHAIQAARHRIVAVIPMWGL